MHRDRGLEPSGRVCKLHAQGGEAQDLDRIKQETGLRIRRARTGTNVLTAAYPLGLVAVRRGEPDIDMLARLVALIIAVEDPPAC